ncbi:MAG: AhpC/TSA family protein [Bacteroidales bacterium]|nr:MAG: AhpC/TSA family protein [Bacteroidales bacterium]
MNKHICIIFFLTTIFLSCSTNKDNFEVRGTIKNSKNEKVYISRLTTAEKLLTDSCYTDANGNFSLSGKIIDPSFFVLYTINSDYIHLVIHPKDKINIITNIQNFNTEYIVEGSGDSKLIKKLVDKQRLTLEKITSLSIEFDNIKGNSDFFQRKAEIDSVYNIIFDDHKNFSKEFIIKNPGSMVSIMALYQQLGRNAPVFDYKKDFIYFNLVDSNLTALFPNSEAIKSLNKKVVEIREQLQLDIGAKIPDISLPDTLGNMISLSALRGKYVLLDFWASWSIVSRQENPKLVKIYNKYKNEGFEIYQVSLDRTKESWLKGIEKDKLSWINVSDLKFWNSIACVKYDIQKLPANFLLDTTGIIIAKNLTGIELENSLKEILK